MHAEGDCTKKLESRSFSPPWNPWAVLIAVLSCVAIILFATWLNADIQCAMYLNAQMGSVNRPRLAVSHHDCKDSYRAK